MDLAKFMINYNAMCHGTNLTSPFSNHDIKVDKTF